MKSFALTSALLSLAALCNAQIQIITQATFSSKYDCASSPPTNFTCSSSLEPTFPTCESIPLYPAIGGYSGIAASDFASPECGTCWHLQDQETGVSVYFTAVDTAEEGFVLSEETFRALTGAGIGAVAQIFATQVDVSFCDL